MATDSWVSPPPTPSAPEAPGQRPPRRRSWLYAVLGLVVAALLALVLFVGFGTGRSPAPRQPQVARGIGASSAKIADLNVLSGPGKQLTDFALTDQHGRTVSLSGFRGKAVVLSFNDDRCPDLCTLLAQDIVVADRDLGAAARHVVFLSVNVNPFYPQVRYVRAWSDQHGLGVEPNWVFTTGPVDQLRAIWKDYGVSVELDAATRTVAHGTELFFIDPTGRERALGAFGTNAANTSLFAHTMAQMAVDLLPPTERVRVGGPSAPPPTPTNATVGARAPAFSLPLLDRPTDHLSSADLRGGYAVLNFWAATCTACVGELPHVEQVSRDLGTKVRFVGVDVSDSAAAATALARRVGLTYPVVTDAGGTAAGAYRISGLPYTVILGPRGTVLVRHPGAITAEQLRYVLVNLDPALGGGG